MGNLFALPSPEQEQLAIKINYLLTLMVTL